MAAVLDVGQAVDAIVFTGYYHKPENVDYLHELGVDVPYADDYARRKVMPAGLDARVVAAWRRSGISTPLFRKTSCGVAYAHGTPDYNGARSSTPNVTSRNGRGYRPASPTPSCAKRQHSSRPSGACPPDQRQLPRRRRLARAHVDVDLLSVNSTLAPISTSGAGCYKKP